MNSEEMRNAALDPEQIAARMELAQLVSNVFQVTGTGLYAVGHILGTDRRDGVSPFGHGNDAIVAISMMLKISSELVSGSANLIADKRYYAGCALIRQLVEVEYLAWAFETKDEEAARWLRSTHEERIQFFAPAKIRKAAGAHFRSVDYSYHCELGGHPTPGSWALLNDGEATAQLMLADCLGHAGRIWDHIFRWSQTTPYGTPMLSRAKTMWEHYSRWKEVDQLTALPPPPASFPEGY